jgi:hypothetical protein
MELSVFSPCSIVDISILLPEQERAQEITLKMKMDHI